MPFSNNIVGKLEYLTADGIGVSHCFSTRLGGVSEGTLASLNLGIHRGDRPANVLENYRILGRAMGFSIQDTVFARQTHSDIVRRVDASNAGEGLFFPVPQECDGLVTNTPGLVLTVFTADCTPILFHDSVTGAVGACHAGWRGTVADIAGKTVAAMVREYGCRPENIHAAIGPNIGFCCFETDADVPNAVRALLGEAAEPFIRSVDEKFRVDIKGVNEFLLRRAGVEQIDISSDCTACQPDRFWSHRVTRGHRGSLAALIKCEGGAEA